MNTIGANPRRCEIYIIDNNRYVAVKFSLIVVH